MNDEECFIGLAALSDRIDAMCNQAWRVFAVNQVRIDWFPPVPFKPLPREVLVFDGPSQGEC